MKGPDRIKITSDEPLVGALSFFSALASSGDKNPYRDTALTTELGDITIDTCLCHDTQEWETGVKREKVEGKWVIVSQYRGQEEAKQGHSKWVAYLKENPNAELRDIDLWNLASLNDNEN